MKVQECQAKNDQIKMIYFRPMDDVRFRGKILLKYGSFEGEGLSNACWNYVIHVFMFSPVHMDSWDKGPMQ